jgi:hypothetical protein
MTDAIATEFTKAQRDSDLMISFGFRLKNQFAVNKVYRRAKELEWLESIRQYKGLYDPDVKLDPNASKVYPKITRSKVNIVLSRLHEMLFPETEKNWEITHTPEPKISRETVKQIAMSLVKEDPETGEAILPTPDELNLAIKKYAKTTCERMSSVIDDQLTEMDYPEETKKVLRSGLMYGTGVMKGPLINQRSKRRWKPGQGGEYEEEVSTEEVPFFEFVRIWDWYPDMSVTELDKSEGSFERHLMTKHDLRQLAKRSDFYADMILKYLEEFPNGDYVPDNWELDLQTIEVEAGQGKAGRTQTAMTAATSEFDQRSSNRQTGKKYQVLSFWGYVDGNDLAACGKEITDTSLEYAANVWLLGNRPIKAELFEGAIDKYKLFYYEKDETSLFGEGLPRIMRHSQLSISAGARMVLDNGACVAGPQVEVNWSLILPDTDINSFYPRKIWYREGKGVDAQYPAIRSLQFDSHIEELLKIIDAFKQFADEETTLPTWLVGQMVNNETAQATSGRMSTITISIKDVVKNFDTFTEGIIRDLYAWNMEFNPRTDIKGDYNVKARGVSSLVMKEIRMGALTQLTSTLTPEEWDYIPRREFIEEKFKAYDLNIKLRTEEEVQKIREERENSRQMQLAYAQAEADIAYKKAQTAGQLTKAKKLNVEATKDAQTPIEQPENADPRINEAELAIKETEMAGKMGDQRRKEEAHAQKLAHQEDKHQTTKAIDTTKTAQELAINREKAEYERRMKEKTTQASIQTKKQAAKVKKSPSATKKPAKKG